MDQSRFQLSWRRLLLFFLLLLLTVWVFSRFTDFQNLASTLSQARWGWVVVSVVLHLLYFGMYAQLYHFGFAVVGVESRFRDLVPVMFAALFTNVVAPSGGAAGAALFVDDAAQRGESGARAAVGTVLVLLADLATLIPFILYSVIYLRLQGQLQIYDSLSSGIFVLFILFLSLAIGMAGWRPDLFRSILGWVRRAANWIGAKFHHPDLLDEEWPEKNARDFKDAATAIANKPRPLLVTLAWATALHLVNLIGLYVLFLAFEQPVRLGTLVAGFSMGIVFFVVTVVPSGLAAVEGIMSLVFTDLGVPSTKAAAVVLAFRGVNFWMPLILGFFLLLRVRTFRHGASSSEEEAAAPTGEDAPSDSCRTEEQGAD